MIFNNYIMREHIINKMNESPALLRIKYELPPDPICTSTARQVQQNNVASPNKTTYFYNHYLFQIISIPGFVLTSDLSFYQIHLHNYSIFFLILLFFFIFIYTESATIHSK